MPQETVRTRGWLEQQRRNFKAWQLKRQHAQQLAFQMQLAALPQLQVGRTFRTDNLSDFAVPNITANSVPELPVMERPNYLYRGLGLDNDQNIRNILTNGLRVQDVGNYSNGLLMALAATPHDAAAISSSKYTNLTKIPATALNYAVRNAKSMPKGIAVIVSVSGEERYGTLVQLQHDIPAEKISALMALLNIDGTPTWCRVQLQEGDFVITPYGK